MAHVIASLTMIPLGTSTPSVSRYVADVLDVLDTHNLKYQLTPMCTIVEGDEEKIFKAIIEIKKNMFKMGIKPETADNCPACNLCLMGCPMATTPSSTDCTWCTDCMNDCPEESIIVGHRLQKLAAKPGEPPEEPEEPVAGPGAEELELL